MIIAILIIWGLCLGSFVSALVWRLHAKQQRPKTKKKLTNKQLSIINGRSVCTHCGHQLAAKDLVPVISWLQLRGKCRYCHNKIDDSPIVELGTAALFVVSYLAWPYGFAAAAKVYFIVWLACVVGFMALTVYDIRWYLLPDRLVLPLTVLVSGYVILSQLFAASPIEHTAQIIISVLILSGIFSGLYAISRGKWIGFGDVKLSFLLGLLATTPLQAVLLIFIASCSGLVFSLPLLAAKKLKPTSHIPFGPFLLLATVIIVLWGPQLESWLHAYMYLTA